jgi:tetratricopeptide (TPR) repeat protein
MSGPAPENNIRPRDMGEILLEFKHLADRALCSFDSTLAPFVEGMLRICIRDITNQYALRPEVSLNSEAAEHHLISSQQADVSEKYPEALSHALRGLVYSPHSPDLWHAAADAVIGHGRMDLAAEMLEHVLRIDPARQNAKEDLDYLKKRIDEWKAENAELLARLDRANPPLDETNL